MAFSDIFIGVPQSKFAGLAILVALIFVSFAILVGKEPIPMGQRLMFILMMFLISLPGILLTIFQLTCLVSGAGFKNQRWWCSLYAWIGTGLVVLYSIILVVAAVMSMLSGSSMVKELAEMEQMQVAKNNANAVAQEMFENKEQKDDMMMGPVVPKPPMMPEGFEDIEVPKIVPDMSVGSPMKPTALITNKESFNDSGTVIASDPEMFTSCGAPVPPTGSL